MSILRSMNTAASGLRAHTEAIGTSGDNIANVNTIGFKGQRGVFQDVLGRSVGGGSATPLPGAGSRLAHIETMWVQGALLTTDSPTDLALSGDGFFVVNGVNGSTDGNFFTRAGQFHIDNQGYLVNASDLRLQGYTSNEDGTMGVNLGDLRIEGASLPARATSSIDMSVQLDANAQVPVDDLGADAPFDPNNASATSNFSTEVSVYDSLGNAHNVSIYFRKSAESQWSYHAVVDGPEVGEAAGPFEVGSGTLTFDGQGRLDTEVAFTPVNPAGFAWEGADPGNVTFNFGTSVTGEGGSGLDGTTQFGDTSTFNAVSQDGHSAGSISGIAIAGDGQINGVFTNGQRKVIGQVAVAKFTSQAGLQRASQGLYQESPTSGSPLIGAAQTGGRGQIVAGALEQSNVDLGREFVNLITVQRGFQANARIVTTADDMYAELVNLKR